MPYASNAELPDAVKKLPSKLQTAWRKAFNSALSSYGDETSAFRVAWSQVNKMRETTTFHPSFLRVLSLFTSRYGEEAGRTKFDNFVMINGLDPEKSYNPHHQFAESFSWAEPYIRFIKADKEAKYYAVRALHAIVSMNNNDYRDINQMEVAAQSMNYRPLNYNHDHTRWLPYPRTRVDYAKAEDMCVELILRVDNQDVYLQKQLDHDPSIPEKEWINHPSIEGRPMIGGSKEGYHFTALAMLEKGYQLPGDPLSEIYPIMIEGIQGGEVCLMVDGEEVCLTCTDAGGEKMEKVINKEDDIGTMVINEAYASGEINKEGAVCPNCGHIVDLQDINSPADVACPNCGASMVRRPEKTIEQLVTLTKEEIIELFRPPFNGDLDSYHKRFTKTTGDDLVSTDIPSVPVVKGKKIGIVEQTQLDAMKAEHALELTKLKDLHMSELKIRDEEIAKLNETLSDTKKAIAKGDAVQSQLAEKISEVTDLKTEISSLKGENRGLKESVRNLQGKIELLSGEKTALVEDVAALKQRLESKVTEHQRDLEKLAKNTQTANNEIQNRARLQEEVSALRQDMADLTRKYSTLTEKSYTESKRIQELEQELLDSKNSAATSDKFHEDKMKELTKTLEEAKKFHRWAWGKLKEAGYAIVE